MTDFNWVHTHMAVGGRLRAGVAERLARHFGIRRVVDLRQEDVDDVDLLCQHGVCHLHLPTPDNCAVLSEQLWQGVQWVQEGLDRGEKALLHCEYGIGRSVLLAACVLVSQGQTPAEALGTIRRGRRQASPNRLQLAALLGWAGEWCQRACRPVPRQTLRDLEHALRGWAMPDLFDPLAGEPMPGVS